MLGFSSFFSNNTSNYVQSNSIHGNILENRAGIPATYQNFQTSLSSLRQVVNSNTIDNNADVPPTCQPFQLVPGNSSNVRKSSAKEDLCEKNGKMKKRDKHPVMMLNEIQPKLLYSLEQQTGPPHSPTFLIKLHFKDKVGLMVVV